MIFTFSLPLPLSLSLYPRPSLFLQETYFPSVSQAPDVHCMHSRTAHIADNPSVPSGTLQLDSDSALQAREMGSEDPTTGNLIVVLMRAKH